MLARHLAQSFIAGWPFALGGKQGFSGGWNFGEEQDLGVRTRLFDFAFEAQLMRKEAGHPVRASRFAYFI
jgi:hypothetical protein